MTIKVPKIFRALVDGDIISNTAPAIVEPTWWLVQAKGVTVEEFRYKKEAEGWLEAQPADKREMFTLVSEKRLEPVEHAIQVAKVMLDGIREGTGAHDITVFLTSQDKSNFRYKLAKSKPYKGNRSGEKPTHYQAVYDYLASRDYTRIVYNMEADDAIAWEQYDSYCRVVNGEDGGYWCDSDLTCIASTDKDFKQVPGYHYNFSTKELYYINDDDATYNLAHQWLTGDPIDNIPGLPGIGKAKATKILAAVPKAGSSPLIAARRAYLDAGRDDEYAREQFCLVYLIRKKENYEDIIRQIKGA